MKEENIWKEKLDLLNKFFETNHGYPSQFCDNKKERDLGRFVAILREKSNKNKLKKEISIALESLVFWSYDASSDELWMDNFYLLKTFYITNNRYPKSISNNIKENLLGNWVEDQVKDYGNKKLSKNKLSLLESLPKWNWENELDEQWNEKYEKIKKFYNTHQVYPNDHSKDLNEANLGMWIKKQKNYFKKSKLEKNRIERLQILPNWIWEKDKVTKWNDKYHILEKFIETNNNFPDKKSRNIHEKSMLKWIKKQKRNYHKKLLADSFINKLEKLPDWTWD